VGPPSRQCDVRYRSSSHLTLRIDGTRFHDMALWSPSRLLRCRRATYLAIALILLCFVSLEVFDIDGSNLPMAVHTVATVLEERRLAEAKSVLPQESLDRSASAIHPARAAAQVRGAWPPGRHDAIAPPIASPGSSQRAATSNPP
jgi:hypothetical protein